MPKITPDQIAKAAEAAKQASLLIEPINNRCEEIVNSLCKIFRRKLDWWHMGSGEANEISGGSFDFSWEEFAEVTMYVSGHMICDLKEGEGILLNEGFPLRFFFEDFEKEVEDGMIKAKERIEREKIEKKEKAQAKKIRKLEVAKAAKEKLKNVLTSEERKALGV